MSTAELDALWKAAYPYLTIATNLALAGFSVALFVRVPKIRLAAVLLAGGCLLTILSEVAMISLEHLKESENSTDWRLSVWIGSVVLSLSAILATIVGLISLFLKLKARYEESPPPIEAAVRSDKA